MYYKSIFKDAENKIDFHHISDYLIFLATILGRHTEKNRTIKNLGHILFLFCAENCTNRVITQIFSKNIDFSI